MPESVEPSEDEEIQLPWDEPQAELPVELAFLWTNKLAGERRLDMKTVLGSVPRFKGLPRQAPQNNHRYDSNSKQDKKERAWQQTLLHGLRLFSTVYLKLGEREQGQAVTVLVQQLFQLLYANYSGTLCQSRVQPQGGQRARK